MTATRYPLSWPAGWKRTPAYQRRSARFTKCERVYSGTPGRKRHWRDVLGMSNDGPQTLDRARDLYRQLASVNHPDRGGSAEKMAEINAAWTEAQQALGGGQ